MKLSTITNMGYSISKLSGQSFSSNSKLLHGTDQALNLRTQSSMEQTSLGNECVLLEKMLQQIPELEQQDVTLPNHIILLCFFSKPPTVQLYQLPP